MATKWSSRNDQVVSVCRDDSGWRIEFKNGDTLSEGSGTPRERIEDAYGPLINERFVDSCS